MFLDLTGSEAAAEEELCLTTVPISSWLLFSWSCVWCACKLSSCATVDFKNDWANSKWHVKPWSHRAVSQHALGMTRSFQGFNLAALCSQTCRAGSIVGSSFFISWPRCPLVYSRGQREMSEARRTVELEVPASRLVAPTSATQQHREHGCEQGYQRERARVCVGVPVVCVCE